MTATGKRFTMKRRTFLKTMTLSAAGLAVGGRGPAQATGQPAAADPIPRRAYGHAGDRLSVIGFGGILVMGVEQDHANRLVAEAVERGVNYFDVAPSYGNAEERLGPALEPFRKRVFLAGKTEERTRDGAAAHLERTLKRFRTDHLDLYQLHGLTDMQKDVSVAFGPGGAMETLVKAKTDGRVRHLGFSAHNVDAALSAMERYAFDSVLFPVNFACWHAGNFGPQVLAKAQEKGLSVLALKALAWQPWPEGSPRPYSKCWYQPIAEPEKALPALKFTLSQSISALLTPGDERLFRLVLELLPRLTVPLSEAESRQLQNWAREVKPIFRYPLDIDKK
jgi:diketogulonate reductase-like aldo/keto reductase